MILEKIERFYVDEKHPDDLLKDAIDGMLFGLDPHSIYLTPDQYKDYSKKYNGYVGFGLKYCKMDSVLVISSLVENGPADVAGLRIGDRIHKIAGIKVADIKSGSIERFLSERQEKLVSMLIHRPGRQGRFSVDLLQRQIVDKSIPVYFMIRDGVGYIKISYFSDSTPKELDIAFAQLENAGMSRLVLDLRDNSGGTFNSGVAVADHFIPSGRMIVFTKGRAPQSSEQFVATLPASTVPLVVMVNEATASDAEIVSGAIQDWDRGLIVGRRTYGKALVQTEFAFQDESVLLLTTARYYTPLGRLIQKKYKESDIRIVDKKEEKPKKYRTPKGRIVYGGGGIQPDITLKEKNKYIPKGLRPLYTPNENIFFNFADNYVILHSENVVSFKMNSFLRNFEVSAALWQQFKQFVQQSAVTIPAATMESNAVYLKNELKAEIAGRLWGDKGRFAAIIANDFQVQASLNYFEQAAALLNH